MGFLGVILRPFKDLDRLTELNVYLVFITDFIHNDINSFSMNSDITQPFILINNICS